MLRLGGSNKQLAKGLLTADSDDEESVDSEDDKFSRLRKVGNASSGAIRRSDEFGNTIFPKSPMTPGAKLFKSINLKGRKQQDRRNESDPLSPPTKSPLRTKSADGLPEIMSLASSPKATGKTTRQSPQRSKTTGTMGMMFLSDMATASGYDQDMFKQFQGGSVIEMPAVKAKKNKDVLAAHNAKIAAKKAAKAALGAASSGGDDKKTPKTPGNGKQKIKIRVKVPKGSDPFVVATMAKEVGAAAGHNKPLHCEEGRRRNLTPMRSKIRRSISGATSLGTSEYDEEGHHHAPHTPSRRRRTMNNTSSSSSSHEFGEDHHEENEKESSHHQRRRHRAPLRSKSRSRRKNSQQNSSEHNPTTPRRTFSADDADLFNLDSDFTTNNNSNSVAPNPPQRNAPLRAPSMEDLGNQLTENEDSHQQQTSAMTRTRSRRQVESCKSDSTASFLCENDTDKEQKTTKTFSAVRRRSMKPEKQSSGAGEEDDATVKRTKQSSSSSSSSSRQKSIKRLQPSDREGAMGAHSVQRFSGGCQPRLADHHPQQKLVEHKAQGVATCASRTTTSSSSTPATTTNNNNNNVRVKSTFSNRINTTSATGRQRSGTFVPGNSVQARVRQLNGSSSQ